MCKGLLMEVIHWRRTDSENFTNVGWRGRKSLQWNPSDPLETNRFRWKSPCSIFEILRTISPMSDEGVESRSDGIHRIHWRRSDSDGKVHDLFVRVLEKFIYISVNFNSTWDLMNELWHVQYACFSYDTCNMFVLIWLMARLDFRRFHRNRVFPMDPMDSIGLLSKPSPLKESQSTVVCFDSWHE